MSKFKVGDKVRCIDNEDVPDLVLGRIYTVTSTGCFGCYYLDHTGTGYRGERFELIESSEPSDQFTIGQEVLAAVGITRNLKRATITNVSVGKDNQGSKLVGICVDSMDVIVPEDKLFVMP